MIILDTNVLSELIKKEPDQNVLYWIRLQKPVDLYTTSITKAEMLYGVHKLPDGKRKKAIYLKIKHIFNELFENKVLSFSSAESEIYAKLLNQSIKKGYNITTEDTLIASITKSNNAKLATRNIKDFKHSNINLINPWNEDN